MHVQAPSSETQLTHTSYDSDSSIQSATFSLLPPMALRRPQPQNHRSFQCLRHPTPTPPTGLCPLCLRERLAGVESSLLHRSIPNQHLVPDILNRSKSSSAATCGVSLSNSNQTRRKSCDARARSSSLLDLFNSADERRGPEKGLGLETNEIKVCSIEEGNATSSGAEELDIKTVREFLDLELQSSRLPQKDSKGFWNFSAKLRKWRSHGKTKKQGKGGIEEGKHQLRRNSCEIEPRVPSDGTRNSFEEPRASLDGYFLGRTYRLTPMVSVIEDAEIIHSHSELERKKPLELQSAIDRSSSQKKREAPSIANGNVALNARELFYGTKLVITEKELMTWNSGRR